MIYTYTWYIWVNQEPTIPKISTTGMKLILQIPFGMFGGVMSLWFFSQNLGRIQWKTWAMFQALTFTITRTDPWNCSLETVYIAVWVVLRYICSHPGVLTNECLFKHHQTSAGYRIAFWLGEWYQSIPILIKFPKTLCCRCLYPKRRLPKNIPLKVWRKQGHPGESALQQKPATMRFDYKMAILVPATQKNTKCTSCKIS